MHTPYVGVVCTHRHRLTWVVLKVQILRASNSGLEILEYFGSLFLWALVYCS